jgi:hypothetical protein
LPFHQDALGLSDDVARAQPAVQCGFAVVDFLASVRHRHRHGQIRCQDRTELLVLVAERGGCRAVEGEGAER